jgi:hypothetical protein
LKKVAISRSVVGVAHPASASEITLIPSGIPASTLLAANCFWLSQPADSRRRNKSLRTRFFLALGGFLEVFTVISHFP